MDHITALKGNFDDAHNMLIKFIEICPDEIWGKTSGGFPVWQQVFHAIACYDYFVRDENAAPTTLLFGEKESGVVLFKESPTPPAKQELLLAAEKAKKLVYDFLASQNDTTLSQKHAGFYARRGKEISNLGILSRMAGHNMYHLGSCDAALRDAGLEGVF